MLVVALCFVAAHSPNPQAVTTSTEMVGSLKPAPTAGAVRHDDEEQLAPGRYRLVLRYTIGADVPVLGKVVSVTTTNAIVDLDDAGRARQHVCSIFTTSSGSVKTEATAALIRGMPVSTYALRVRGGKVTADMGAGALGYDGDSDAALPANAQDARITDPDGDGVPGAAMDVVMPGFGRFPINVVSRGRTELLGVVTGNGTAAGRAIVTNAGERVLGGFVLANALPAQGVEPDPATSRFTLERIKDGAGCHDINRGRD